MSCETRLLWQPATWFYKFVFIMFFILENGVLKAKAFFRGLSVLRAKHKNPNFSNTSNDSDKKKKLS
jgi:hypothetical protein